MLTQSRFGFLQAWGEVPALHRCLLLPEAKFSSGPRGHGAWSAHSLTGACFPWARAEWLSLFLEVLFLEEVHLEP